MKSFDFYDTLFTRLVGTPHGIFLLVERMLGIDGFAAARARAELRANDRISNREITLDEIYECLEYDPEILRSAKKLELQLEEELLYPIKQNIARIAPGDLVISDIYLPKATLQSALDSHVSADLRPTLIVSSETGHRKSDGSLWRRLSNENKAIELHIGDNKQSDVRRPMTYGIRAEHYTAAALNRYENRYLESGLDGNLIAGLSRGTRLAEETPDPDRRGNAHYLCSVFASVISPVLISFVEEVLADCIRREIKVALFFARDGQLLYEIATRLIAARSLEIRARYVYASRHALHMAGYRDPVLAASWLLEDTPILTIAEISRRASLSPTVFAELASAIGIGDVDQNIPRAKRAGLIEAIKSSRIVAEMHRESARQWPSVYQYYEASGLTAGEKVALIDVGWTGRMHASLRSVLLKANVNTVQLVGHYLCLSSKLRISDSDELVGFLHDPEFHAGTCPFDPYRPVIEASLLADHGTTVGFDLVNGSVAPRLGAPPSQFTLKTVRLQQQTVLRFVDLMLRVEAISGHRIHWPKDIVKRNLLRMLKHPTMSDALAFADHELATQQVEDKQNVLIASNTSLAALANRQKRALWPEGSLAAAGKQSLIPLVSLLRRLRSYSRMDQR